MAEGVTPEPGRELERSGGRELEAPKSKELTKYTPPTTHGHEHKFRFTYAALGGFALAAVAATVIFVMAGKPAKPPQWSPWKPTAGGDEALRQIADHVAPAYRLPTGEQLVAVDGGPLQIQGIPVKIVLLRSPRDFSLADGKGALFTLCGLGTNCSIKAGKPSHERMLLLRREAQELALYTFRYVKDVQQVVVLLPPAPGAKPSVAMFIRKGDVRSQLQRPLHMTLSPKPPSIRSLKAGPMASYLEKLTLPEVYNFDVVQSQDASVLLELARFPLQSQSQTQGSNGP
jgi:hypothetical protein